MKTVPGVAVVIYDAAAKKILLLHRVLNWNGWECVKGHVDGGESSESAVKREVKEETGIEIQSIRRLPATLEFSTPEGEMRSHDVYAAYSAEQPVAIGVEHDDAKWVTVDEAKKLLTYPSWMPIIVWVERIIETEASI